MLNEDIQKEMLNHLMSFFTTENLSRIIEEHTATLDKKGPDNPIRRDSFDPYHLKSCCCLISQDVLEKGNVLSDLQQVFNTSNFVIEILNGFFQELHSIMQEYYPSFSSSEKKEIEDFFEEQVKFLSDKLNVLRGTIARAYLRSRLLENTKRESEHPKITSSITMMREHMNHFNTIHNENDPYEFAVTHGLLKKLGYGGYTPIFEDGKQGLKNVLDRWYELSEKAETPMPTYEDLARKLRKSNGEKYNKDTIRNYLSALRIPK